MVVLLSWVLVDGQSDNSVTPVLLRICSRGTSGLLLLLSADVRSSADVIAFEGRREGCAFEYVSSAQICLCLNLLEDTDRMRRYDRMQRNWQLCSVSNLRATQPICRYALGHLCLRVVYNSAAVVCLLSLAFSHSLSLSRFLSSR